MSLKLLRTILSRGYLSNLQKQTVSCYHSKNILQSDNKNKDAHRKCFSSTQPEDNGKLLTVPNVLSTFRIASTPYICYLIIYSQFTPALYWFAAASISDFLDGFIARRWPSQQSRLGAVLDPLGDKLLVVLTCGCLTYIQVIPWWLTSLFAVKDLSLIIYGLVVRYKTLPPPVTFKRFINLSIMNVEVQASMLSKTNTLLQMCLLWTSMCFNVFDVSDNFLHLLWAVTATTTTASMVQYCIKKPFKVLPPKK